MIVRVLGKYSIGLVRGLSVVRSLVKKLTSPTGAEEERRVGEDAHRPAADWR